MAPPVHRRRLLLGLAAVVAVAAAVAIALSSGGSQPGAASRAVAASAREPARAPGTARAELTAAARYLGVSVARLHRELRGGHSLGELARSTPGKTEAGLIEAIAKQPAARTPTGAERRLAGQVNTSGAGPSRPLLSFREDARAYLGLSVAQLRARSRGGRSLAQIARATAGRSEAGLIDAVFDARRRQLQRAVRTGRLRADVYALTIVNLRQRVQRYVRFAPAGGGS